MKRNVLLLSLTMLLLCAACTGSPDSSQSPSPETQTASAGQDVNAINTEVLLQWNMDEVKAERDALYNGRTLDAMLPNERHNALLLDYYIELNTSAEQEPVSSNYTRYPFNEPAEVDLNGDGVPESITVIPLEDKINEGRNDGVLLRVNDLEVTYAAFFNIDDGFAIVDIDTNDPYKEIVISDLGPSNDLTSVFYGYDGEKIIYMNEGCNQNRPMPEEMREYSGDEIGGLFSTIECTGNGFITARQRAAILQTWWYPIRYSLTEEHLLRVLSELFTVDQKVFVLQPMELYTERDDTSPIIPMEKDTFVRLTALDDIQWVQVTLPDGQNGWFKVKNHNVIVTENGDISAADVFFQLWYYD